MSPVNVPASFTYLGELVSHPRFIVKVWTDGAVLMALFAGWAIIADNYVDLQAELAKW